MIYQNFYAVFIKLLNINNFLFDRYISNHLHGLFAGAWEPQPTNPLPVDIPMPTQSQGNPDPCHFLHTLLHITALKLKGEYYL